MGLKEIFSSLKSNSTSRRHKKSQRYNIHNCSLDTQSHTKIKNNNYTMSADDFLHDSTFNQSSISFNNTENRHIHTLASTSYHGDFMQTPLKSSTQTTLNRHESIKSTNNEATSHSTRVLIENHAKHINSILDAQNACVSKHTVRSPSSSIKSMTRNKIRTNPWIRSPSFNSTQIDKQTHFMHQNESCYSICNQCTNKSCLSIDFHQHQKSPHTPNSSLSSYSRSSQKDEYSILFEETLEKSPSKLIHHGNNNHQQHQQQQQQNDNNLVAEVTNLFDKALSELPNSHINDSKTHEVNMTQHDVELEESVHELYRQIELLKEQKRYLDEKMNFFKQQNETKHNHEVIQDVCKFIQEIRL